MLQAQIRARVPEMVQTQLIGAESALKSSGQVQLSWPVGAYGPQQAHSSRPATSAAPWAATSSLAFWV